MCASSIALRVPTRGNGRNLLETNAGAFARVWLARGLASPSRDSGVPETERWRWAAGGPACDEGAAWSDRHRSVLAEDRALREGDEVAGGVADLHRVGRELAVARDLLGLGGERAGARGLEV